LNLKSRQSAAVRRRLAITGRAAGDTFETPLTQEQISEAAGHRAGACEPYRQAAARRQDRRCQQGARGGRSRLAALKPAGARRR